MISICRNSSHKSPRNYSTKNFHFLLSVLKLAEFFLALQNGIIATSRQQEIEMVCLSIIYYRATLGDKALIYPLCCD